MLELWQRSHVDGDTRVAVSAARLTAA
jgi:hypothetical protein